jgi:hypothetical protein
MEITLENYEAFYLDYLEGNLSDSDRFAFELFLDQHPDLKMEDDELPTIISDQNVFDKSKKTALLQGIDAHISFCETLMIGELEGVNSKEESQLFSQFLKNEFALNETYLTYKKTILSPDKNEVYPHKNDLKKRETIVFWPWISAAAASVILMFSIYNYNQKIDIYVNNKKKPSLEFPNVSNQIALQNTQNTIVGQKKTVKFKSKNRNNVIEDEAKQTSIEGVKIALQTMSARNISVEPLFVKMPEITHIPKNKEDVAFDDPTIIVDESNLNDLAINNFNNSITTNEFRTNKYEIRPFEKMPNPISGITQIAEKLTNTDIDFRKADATKRKSGGVHIKIGKFEYSRRKR